MKTSRIASPLTILAVLALALVPAASAQDTGSADFTRFVALGDSLSQGFSNGGVYQGVQVNSIPALVARQAGVPDFEQPLISAPGIPGLLRLAGLVPPTVVPRPGNGQPVNLNLPRPYNNLAVSGFDVRDVVVTRTGNPIIDVTLRGLGTALEQAAFLQPTLAFVWLGNNDVLGAATSGIVIDGVTLTRPDQFAADLQTVVGTLQAVGADIVMANIPDVTAIPFVNTLAPVLVNPQTQQPVRDPNGNLIPLIGPDGPLGSGDRVLLSATTELAMGKGLPPALGGTGPLSNSAVLSAAELALISNRVQALNAIIANVANQSGAAFFDVNAFFRGIVANGYHVGGITLTPAFLTGGIFSYDGVHPAPVGYAVLANGFIEAINDTYGAEIPPVNLNPFLFGPDGAAGAILPPGTAVQSTLYTEAAERNLRSSLRVPPRSELERQGGGGPVPLIPRGTRLSPLSPMFEPAVAP
jgi:hypothetical protein